MFFCSLEHADSENVNFVLLFLNKVPFKVFKSGLFFMNLKQNDHVKVFRSKIARTINLIDSNRTIKRLLNSNKILNKAYLFLKKSSQTWQKTDIFAYYYDFMLN